MQKPIRPQNDQHKDGFGADASHQEASFGSGFGTGVGLSTKLLLLTVAIVMIAEVLIFIPSIANFRTNWMKMRMDTARAVSLAFMEAPDLMPSHEVEENILDVTQALAIRISMDKKASYLARGPVSEPVATEVNLSTLTLANAISPSMKLLLWGGDALFSVHQQLENNKGHIVLTHEEKPLRDAMLAFAFRILFISLFISVITGLAVFGALYRLIVLPIKRISDNMTAFSNMPEDHSRVYKVTNRHDEIGIAEHRLRDLQKELQKTLLQKKHLAELGMAVSKINHDLRNILSSASLFSDRISALDDPTVQRLAPKLIRTINRAANYTRAVMDFGKAVEAPPNPQICDIKSIGDEVMETLGHGSDNSIMWENTVDEQLRCFCDQEHLFRIMMNICRNARKAMKENDETRRGHLQISAKATAKQVTIRICDNGPGISKKMQDGLFAPFHSTASGGTGLGLAIALELAKVNQGSIELESTDENGTCFLIKLPTT